MKRRITDCPHRAEVHSADSDSNLHMCRLLEEISGVSENYLLQVTSEVCEACCASFIPTMDDWNPVIASLLNGVAESVIQAGGVDGCTTEQGESLVEAAIQNLPIVLPDEDDGVDDIQEIVTPRQVTVEELKQIVPVPNPHVGPRKKIWSWGLGVTTAPRRQPTLSVCLDSLITSGWTRPHLFVDGDVVIEERFANLPQNSRPESIGAWPAWVEALRELIRSYPDADVLAIVQDDSLLPGVTTLKEYVDSVVWPENRPCMISLYTSTDDALPENVWRSYPSIWKYGAVALALSPDVGRRLLESADNGDLDFIAGTAGIDTRVGIWANRMGVPIWHPSPSLIQHIGQVSSVWKRSRAVGLRRAERFLGNDLPRAEP